MSQPIIPGDTRRIRRRSKAWVYYALLAVLTVFAVPSTHGSSVIATVLFSLYAAYIYRGGRVVVWFW